MKNPWPRDLLGLSLLIVLSFIFLPAWIADPQRYYSDVIGQMASAYILPAMGFLLALRCGAIDMSVWACFALGGAVSAGLINAGLSPLTSSIAGILSGLLVGFANSVLTVFAKISAILCTLVIGIAVILIMFFVSGKPTIKVPDETFSHWRLVQQVPGESDSESNENTSDYSSPEEVELVLPLSSTRMLLVAGFYSALMLALIIISETKLRIANIDNRKLVFVALIVSGGLAGAGGAIWLIGSGSAPLLTRPIGDLRIPAAALLAGGLLFAGSRRVLLACLCLPLSFLIATLWRQETFHWQMFGYSLQMLLLIALVVSVHLLFVLTIKIIGKIRKTNRPATSQDN